MHHVDAEPGYDGLQPLEREMVNEGRWFASLSLSDRHDLMRLAKVRRYAAGDLISARGQRQGAWYACVRGTVRISSVTASGRLLVLTYVRAGVWFGDPGLFDDGPCTHDAHAHGATTVLAIPAADLRMLLEASPTLSTALLRLQARHVRELYQVIEEVRGLPLRPRLAKQLIALARAHGVPSRLQGEGTRIGLCLAQGELAQLIGATRQRVSTELKQMERSGWIRQTATCWCCAASPRPGA